LPAIAIVEVGKVINLRQQNIVVVFTYYFSIIECNRGVPEWQCPTEPFNRKCGSTGGIRTANLGHIRTE
jgi:hypothetical protein